ncbi:MAG: YfhO family protein [Clostridia bacterium]|nr:YfhO family protein [Clostridia bacterium]
MTCIVIFCSILAIILFLAEKKNKFLSSGKIENYLIIGFGFLAFFILFRNCIVQGFKLSYSNLIYNRIPFKSLGVMTTGPELSDPIDEFFPNLYRAYKRLNIFQLWSNNNVFGYNLTLDSIMYPLNWVYILGFNYGQTILYILKHLIGFIGMYLFLRNLKFSKFGAYIGGITYTFSSVMVVWGGWPHSDVTAFAPYLFFAVDKLIMSYKENENASGIIQWYFLFIIILWLMLVAGMPAYAAYFLYFGFAYTIFRLLTVFDFKKNYRFILLFIAILIGCIIISAIMSFAYTGDILFSTSNYQESRRSQAFIYLNWKYLRTFLLPYYKVGFKLHINESTLFTGLLFLFIAPIYFIKKNEINLKMKKEILFWICSFLFIIFLIFTKVAGDFYSLLPMVNTSMKIRDIVLINFIGSVISALTYELVVLKGVKRKKYISLWLILISVIITIYCFVIFKGSKYNFKLYGFNLLVYIWSISILLGILINCKYKTKSIISALLCIIVTANVAQFAHAYIPMIDKNADAIPKPTSSVKYLQENTKNGERVLGIGKWNLFPNMNIFYDYDDIRGHGFINTKSDIENYLKNINADIYDTPTRTSIKNNISGKNLLSYASVKYIVNAQDENHLSLLDRNIKDKGTKRKAEQYWGDNEIVQTFNANYNNLSAIALLVSTYNKQLSSRDFLNVKIYDETHNILTDKNINLSTINDNSFCEISVDKPVENSNGKRYTLILSSQKKFEKPFAVWITDNDIYDGNLIVGKNKRSGDICFVPSYYYDMSFNDGEQLTINKQASPRVYFANNFVVKGTENEILEAMKDKYLPNTAFVLSKDNGSLLSKESESSNESKVLSYSNEDNCVVIKANAKAGSMLVLNDYYTNGWKAYINGKKTDILKVNYLFRGVVIPKDGTYKIVFKYEPTTLYIEIGISGIGFVCFILLIIFRKKINNKLNKIKI